MTKNNDKILRVLHVVTIMNLGGIETFLMTLYRNLDYNIIQFDFLVHREEEGFFDEEIKKLGGKIFHIRSLNPRFYFEYRKQLKSILQANHYNIIHSHLNANSSIILRIAKEMGIKCRIAHGHSDTTTRGLKGMLKLVNKLFINNVSTHRFACSDRAGKWLFGENVDFKVIKNAIDTSKFRFNNDKRRSIRIEFGFNDNTIVIGNVARFNFLKNHAFIMDVFAAVVTKYSDSKLLLLGDGELLEEVKNKTFRLGLEDKVIFAGAVGNANEYLNAMDVFLFPSLFEGLGIVAIEAQTNGLPVVMNYTLPQELDITPLAHRLSLSAPLEEWADAIWKVATNKTDRTVWQPNVTEKGYDVQENVKLLTSFYQKATIDSN
ncbi:glycosyltransferase family 1 protein [Olivibacter sp. LS-1]|uniref:glycosyltransferase family 1 protein n=1 Tax=unclassified Olivibacter TaxID=2632301 RepID=UPI0011EAFC17|nr:MULTISPECIES: glycosyltransferase family 1 protein [unclassified Olivibacter]MDM8177222.1 glycosyltransferase family 1 protein [Olivibacter sp. 47]QEL00378.1 glycosyltransferase family 1 protein [Olivibacter sp. LS-1]